jgi:hypothetical protein
MMKTSLLVVALVLLILSLPAFGKTYKSMYPVPCSDLWGAVTDTLGNPDNHYEVKDRDDAKMTASYDVKHEAHVTVTGIFLQRMNKVTLVPKGATCQMQVVSNFSGWEHSDRGDFKKRVDDSLAKLKNAPNATPAKQDAKAPAAQAKPEAPAPAK